MKNKLLSIVFLMLIIVACNPNEPEETQPTALFSYALNDMTVSFTNASQDSQTYLWEFGDGATSEETNPKHTYAKAGTFIVTLTATNVKKQSKYSQQITISKSSEQNAAEKTPTAMFTHSANGMTIAFTNTSTNAQTYLWDFGDGKTSTEVNPKHTYTSYGTYKIVLTAKNITKTNSYTLYISIKDTSTPKASFSYKIEQPLKVVLTNKSTNATSYEWDFYDGSTSTEKNPTHRYSGKGSYNITLIAKNGTKTDKCVINIKIEEPTKVYLTGYELSKIPIQNKYYRITFTDNYVISPTNFGTTVWSLLSNADMPKTYSFSSPKQITGYNTYWCTLWQSEKSSGSNETNAYRITITKNQLYTKFPETLTNTDQSKAIIKMYFKWE